MLSFLREQGNVELPAQKKARASADKKPDEAEDKSKGSEYYTVAAHGKRARKSTVFLTVLFIIGLLSLAFMIKKSTPQAASAATAETEEVKIETAIARLTGVKSEMFSRMDEIVGKFYEFADVLQVQVNELVKNPFELELFLPNLNVDSDTEENKVEVDAASLWRERIRQKAEKMQLLSIMRSDRGDCCMIDDQILYKGDSVDGFKIKEIGTSSVTLELESKGDSGEQQTQVVLKLSVE
jgi:preprotein translocase subunit SecG